MPTVYITRGRKLCKKSKRLIVKEDETKIADLPLINVDQVVVFGSISVTGAMIQSLLEEDIPLTYLSYYGNYKGRLTPELSPNSVLRMKQFEFYQDKKLSLDLSKQIAAAKISNMRTFLLRSSSGNRSIEIEQVVARMKNILNKLADINDKDSLRGYEGAAAKHYFSVLDHILADEFEFNGRNRRPPKDPVNSLLSFGYSLLLNDVMTAVNLVGLDPYVGFFHSTKEGKPALALDLMEEFRQIVVDAVVKTLINKQMMSRDDFDIKDDKVLIGNEARNTFLDAYERKMKTKINHHAREEKITWRKALAVQAAAIKKYITSKDRSYQPVEVR